MNRDQVRPDGAPLLRVENLYRRFDRVQAVDGVSFEIRPGEVVGFIGANGAGKTTTMRIIATLDYPDSGRVEINGYDVVDHPEQARRCLGWMPDAFGSYADVTVYDYLDFFARACGLRGPARRARVREVMDFVDLMPLAERPMKGLSKGQTQRLCLGRTLLHEPTLLVLDEPAAGLDPKARVEFRNLINLLREQGRAILISSHILSELGEMCDWLLFLDNGRLVHQGTAEELKRGGTGTATEAWPIAIRVASKGRALEDALAELPGWRWIEATEDGAVAEFTPTETLLWENQLTTLMASGVVVVEFHRLERRMEDAFIDLLKRQSGPTPPPVPPFKGK